MALILLRAVWRPPLPAYAPFGSCLCDVGQPAPELSGRRVSGARRPSSWGWVRNPRAPLSWAPRLKTSVDQ
ncbi:hypothetical protein DFH06DRAFT_1465268 [Mycena polygramma]|nr:hypothetical protein DFH06DRAFT_1465268 [Mycena polygramma]